MDFSQLFLKCSHFGDGGITQLSQTDNLSFTAKTAGYVLSNGQDTVGLTVCHDPISLSSWSYICIMMVLHVCHHGLAYVS